MILSEKTTLVLVIFLVVTSNALSQDIFEAVKSSDSEKVRALIFKNDKVVNTKDDRNCTPLHFAAKWGCNGIAELLIQNGADIDDGDVNSNTPLHYAIMNSRADVVNTLLKHGADINAQNKDLSTPLHLAASAGPRWTGHPTR